MKYIYIKIKESANLDLSIDNDFRAIIEKYQGDIEFVEYHLNKDDESEENYIDYLE